MIIKAFAKINLTLDIVGVRPDGFHELESVMAPISLCDKIRLEKAQSFSFACNISALETEDNLCVRAANAFFERAGIAPSASIFLEKNVPFPAGLGGGSADAAAVLKGLNELYEYTLADSALFEIAAGLGSDISVCLLGKLALCRGRGELLTPLSSMDNLNVVIAIGKSRLSTPAVYREYDKANLPPRNDSQEFLKVLGCNDRAKIVSSFGNAFEPVVDVLAPETKSIRELMLKNQALCAHLSGSGPSVYGVFADEESASLAAEKLVENGFSAYVCETL